MRFGDYIDVPRIFVGQKFYLKFGWAQIFTGLESRGNQMQ